MEFTPEILAKLAPTAEGLPIYLDRRPPEVEDPSRKLGPHQWRPACATTSKLTRCLEAARDISITLAPLSSAPMPQAEKRVIKQVITPVYNLAIAVRDLFNHVQSNCWPKLGNDRQKLLVKRFEQFSVAVPTKTAH